MSFEVDENEESHEDKLKALMTDLLEEDQDFEGVNETIWAFEVIGPDGKRERIINPMVEAELAKDPSLRYLRHYTRTLYRIQKLRIAAGLAKGALERLGLNEQEQFWMQENIDVQLGDLEKRLEKRCIYHIKDMPIWTEYLSKISGIGPRHASSLIAFIVTPKRFDTVNKLWKYAGLAVDEKGNIQKLKAGQQANWSQELKKTVYKIEDSFLKVGKGYRKFFDQFKNRETEINEQRSRAFQPHKKQYNAILQEIFELQKEHVSKKGSRVDSTIVKTAIKKLEEQRDNFPVKPPLTKAHVNQRARRRTGKLFLSHLWAQWRMMLGLPTRKPYPIEFLGHTTYIPPFTDVD